MFYNDKENINHFTPYQVELFSPTLGHLKEHMGDNKIYIFWFFVTRGRYKIVYIKHKNEIIHYTHILPQFFKFPFMHVSDLEIGPAWTDEQYRGEGIFTMVMKYILYHFKQDGRTFYAFTTTENISSQKAMLKAGLDQYASGYRTNFLGIYKMDSKI